MKPRWTPQMDSEMEKPKETMSPQADVLGQPGSNQARHVTRSEKQVGVFFWKRRGAASLFGSGF